MAKDKMSLSDFTSMLESIRAKKYKPVYFLEGDESYFIDKVANELEKTVLTEAEKGFNYQVFYGRDTAVLDIISAARRFPMMANHQVIVVREAQYLKKIEELLPYLDNPVPSTILVVLYKGKKVHKGTKFGKALKNHGLLTTGKLSDREIGMWVKGHLNTMGLQAEPGALEFLIQTSGTQLQKTARELEKIQANLGDRKQITKDDVAKYTGIDKEYNVFELNRSLGERNREKCLRIVKYFSGNPKDHPFVLVLSTIYNYFKKVHLVHASGAGGQGQLASVLGVSPYFVGEYVQAARNYPPNQMADVFNLFHEFDLRMKGMTGGQAPENELLTELVIRIIK